MAMWTEFVFFSSDVYVAIFAASAAFGFSLAWFCFNSTFDFRLNGYCHVEDTVHFHIIIIKIQNMEKK